MHGTTRRGVLGAGALLGAAFVLPRHVFAQSPVRLVGPPFSLGVASGYPRPDGISLWTRLAPMPLAPAMPACRTS